MTRKIALIAFAGLAAAQSIAGAQTLSSFALNDGLFRYSESAISGTANRTGTGAGSANFGFIGTNTSAGNSNVASDYLYQNWWWYRSAGDSREFALSNQTFGQTNLAGNSVTLRYDEPIGGSTTNRLVFELTYTLNQISTTQSAVTINWSIFNQSSVVQPVSFFAYADSDMSFTSFSDDNGTYTPGSGVNTYRNDNSLTDTARFFSMSADLRLNDGWQVGPYSTSNVVAPLANLVNGTVNNLSNSDTIAGAGDNAGALQWNLEIPAGQSLGGRVTKGYNYVVPTPGVLALAGIGGLVAARRRRA
ncbi:hypothetical protein LBMAG48_03510 [Phycisphaerae bacterium]|nr:hypothetical protein LBMAG48_03510 [Phycisphaerae bacterium]